MLVNSDDRKYMLIKQFDVDHAGVKSKGMVAVNIEMDEK